MSSQVMSIATNQAIINQIGKRNVLLRELLNYNPNWIINFLTDNAANFQIHVEHTFKFYASPLLSDNWQQSSAEIEKFLFESFKNGIGKDVSINKEVIAEQLSKYIHAQYLEKLSNLSYWDENTSRLFIETSGDYILDDNNIIVWSSFGVINVNESTKLFRHKVKINGLPEINVVNINANKMNELESMLKNKGLEFVNNWTDQEERKHVLKQEGSKQLR